MGKHKKERPKSRQENPTGLPSVKDFEENEVVAKGNTDKVLQKVFEDVRHVKLTLLEFSIKEIRSIYFLLEFY